MLYVCSRCVRAASHRRYSERVLRTRPAALVARRDAGPLQIAATEGISPRTAACRFTALCNIVRTCTYGLSETAHSWLLLDGGARPARAHKVCCCIHVNSGHTLRPLPPGRGGPAFCKGIW